MASSWRSPQGPPRADGAEGSGLDAQLLPEDPPRSRRTSHLSTGSTGSTLFSRMVSPRCKEAAARAVERSQHVAAAPEHGETLLGTSLKVITSGLGAGILAAPWGAAGASLAVATLITGVVLAFNMWTTMIIVHAIDRWGGSKVWHPEARRFVGAPRRPGYRIDDLGQLLRQAPWPLPVFAAVWDLTVNLSNFGVLVGYMIVTGDALTPLLLEGAPALAGRRVSIVLGSLACLPLCWADLAFLTYSSAVGVAANVFLFVVLSGVLYAEGRSSGVCTVGVSTGAFACMSNMIFSVVVQMCIPEYYTQLRRDDQQPDKFFKWVLLPSFIFIFFLMCSFAAVGYLAFGPDVQSNVLKNLKPSLMARCTQFAMVVATLMVYPNMLRPMVQPLLRAKEWCHQVLRDPDLLSPRLSPLPSPAPTPPRSPGVGGACASAASAVDCDNVELVPDIYEGRLVHTETCGPVRIDSQTGESTLEVLDTTGFVKDDLVFVDGPSREYAVVKEVVSKSMSSMSMHGDRWKTRRRGFIRLRPRYNEHALQPEVPPLCALTRKTLGEGTKVVLDQDPALLTAAVVGEQCIQVTFFVGILRGAGIVIGEGARAERHRVLGTKVFRPAAGPEQTHTRTHDLVLYLEKGLRHNHGARTRVVLDHGGVEGMATLIVLGVMLVAFVVTDLGLVNAMNGALSVAVIIGIVPGAAGFYLNRHWVHEVGAGPGRRLPLTVRFKPLSVLLALIGVVVGVAAAFFTDNQSSELTSSCALLA